MAQTQRGIKYPYGDDYDEEADIPEAMKEMAESVDDAIGNSEYDDTGIRESIEDIQDEQAEQNADIQSLQTRVTELEGENEELEQRLEDAEANQLTGTATGESIYISDSASAKNKSIGITGRTTQESTEGKQLFNKDSTNIIASKYLTSTGGTGNSNDFSISDYMEVTENTQYAIQPHRGYGACVCFYDENKNFLSSISLSSVNPDLTTPSNCSYIRSSFAKADVNIFMIEKGSTPTDYEKYTNGASPNSQYPQDIKNTGDSGTINEKVQNKNICPTSSSDYEQGTLANGLPSSSTTRIRLVDYYSIKQGNHYVSSLPSGFKIVNIWFYDKNNSVIGDWRDFTHNESGGFAFEITNQNIVKYKILFAYSDNSTITPSAVETIKPMIEQGSTATDYVPHEEQNISFPLQEGQKLMEGDYLADDGVHHVRNKYIFKGTESFNKNGDCFQWYINSSNPSLSDQGSIDVGVCNAYKFNSVHSGISSSLNNYEFGWNTLKQFTVRDNRFSTVEDFKSNLATLYENGTPVIVEYDLAEEDIDPYTEEQAKVWEQIKALRTYKPVTHISSEDETPATVDIVYVRDLETVIDNIGG